MGRREETCKTATSIISKRGTYEIDDAALIALADRSRLRLYDWPDRGIAPRSYLKRLILCFARAYAATTDDAAALRPLGLDKAVLDVMHRAVAVASDAAIGTPTHDVLAWYAEELNAGGATTARATDRLIAILDPYRSRHEREFRTLLHWCGHTEVARRADDGGKRRGGSFSGKPGLN